MGNSGGRALHGADDNNNKKNHRGGSISGVVEDDFSVRVAAKKLPGIPKKLPPAPGDTSAPTSTKRSDSEKSTRSGQSSSQSSGRRRRRRRRSSTSASKSHHNNSKNNNSKSPSSRSKTTKDGSSFKEIDINIKAKRPGGGLVNAKHNMSKTMLVKNKKGNLFESIVVVFTEKDDVGLVLRSSSSGRSGVRIKSIKPGSQADRAGVLQEGDLVQRINNNPTTGLRAIGVAALLAQRPVKLTLARRVLPKKTEKDFVDVLYRGPSGLAITRDSVLFRRSAVLDGSAPPVAGWRWRPAQVIKRVGSSKDKWTVRYMDERQEDGVAVDDHSEYGFRPYKTASPAHVVHHDYLPGDALDVYWEFPDSVPNNACHWYKTQVVKATPYYIQVHFTEIGAKYDMWLHAIEMQARLAPVGSETDRQLIAPGAMEQEFDAALREDLGLRLVVVLGDGNCLFRSVAYQVLGDADRHAEVRKAACDYMEANENRFAFLMPDGEFPGYIRHMREDRVWGDDPEIRAIEEVFDRPVVIFTNTDEFRSSKMKVEALKLHFDGDLPDKQLQGVEPVTLAYHGMNHYNAVLRKDGRVPLPERKDMMIRKWRVRKESFIMK